MLKWGLGSFPCSWGCGLGKAGDQKPDADTGDLCDHLDVDMQSHWKVKMLTWLSFCGFLSFFRLCVFFPLLPPGLLPGSASRMHIIPPALACGRFRLLVFFTPSSLEPSHSAPALWPEPRHFSLLYWGQLPEPPRSMPGL